MLLRVEQVGIKPTLEICFSTISPGDLVLTKFDDVSKRGTPDARVVTVEILKKTFELLSIFR